jgi:hypothetical protein
MPIHFSLRRLLAAAALALPAASHAQTDLFTVDGNANQVFTGLIGFDLHTGDKDVAITHVGAYDDGKNGFANTITVRMWDRGTRLSIGQDYVFQQTAGTLVGSMRYIELTAPLIIPKHTWFGLYADGYAPGDGILYSNVGPGSPVTIDGGNGLVVYELAWYQPEGAPTATQDPAHVYGAASIRFQDAATITATPEPATIALVGGGLVVVLAAARRRRTLA